MDEFKARIILPNSRTVEFRGPADITEQQTDAIVNAANSYLIGGGGVDGAIHRAGGPSILDECRQFVAQHGQLPAGRAMLTSGGRLAARYVIHTVGPIYSGGESKESELLASCYRECIRLAEQHRMESISFPSISTGAYGYPVHQAAIIAVGSAVGELNTASSLKYVRFVLFDIATRNAYVSAAEKLVQTKNKYRLEEASS